MSNPTITDAIQLALKHHQKGELQQAEVIYRQVLQVEPDNADALHLLGVIANQLGQNEIAIGLIEKAINVNQAIPLYHNNAGNVYRALIKPDEAIACYRRALSLNPDYFEALNNLGSVLAEQGKLDEAIACYHRAVSLDPRSFEAQYNLGNAFKEQGKLVEATACYYVAVSLKPDSHMANFNLGNALAEQWKIDEAIPFFRRAVSSKPDFHEAHYNLGNALADQGKIEEAKAHYRKVFELTHSAGVKIKLAALPPIIMPSKESVLHFRRQFNHAIDDFLQSGVVLNNPLKDIGQTNFFLAYHGLNNRELQIKIAKLYADACPSLLYTAPHCKNGGNIERTGKIKIGFISSYFCEHTMGKHFRGVIANLSRELFNVNVFFGKKRSDEISQFIERNAGKSVSLAPALETAREQIAECELDILFYTDIGMDPFTYFLAFSRLAPVQCVTWGHPDTTGIPNLDYFISCEDFEPEGSETQYSECLVRMKNVPNYFYRPAVVELTGSLEIRRRVGLPADSRLYVAPQSLIKFHPDFDAVLGEILRRDNKGLLILFDDANKHWSTLLMERFLRSMPDVSDRIIFLPRLPIDDFLSLLRSADAVLDTPYFCGGTTSLELFSVGCPIVTWPSSRMASRFTYAYYKKMDIMDLISNNSEQYIQLALRLANDADWREKISIKILERNNIFYDNIDAVRELERFFQSVTAIRSDEENS